MSHITVTLPSRKAKDHTALTVLRDLVLTLPFWRAGGDIKRLDAQLGIADAIDASDGATLQLTPVQKETLGQAFEAAGATIPDSALNRLFSETMRAVLAAS